MTLDAIEADEAVNAVCPHCRGSNIGHVVRVLVATQVNKFFLDPATGELSVLDFSATHQIDWDSFESVDLPWSCMSCEKELIWDAEQGALVSATDDD